MLNIVLVENENDNKNEEDWTTVNKSCSKKAISSVGKDTGTIVSAICNQKTTTTRHRMFFINASNIIKKNKSEHKKKETQNCKSLSPSQCRPKSPPINE